VFAVLGSFVCSCLIFTRSGISTSGFTWIDFGEFSKSVWFVLDNLSKTCSSSFRALDPDPYLFARLHAGGEGKSRYFAALSLFMFAMLGIVLAAISRCFFIFGN
jgi:NADH-quinone oxidoreductase subunit L